MGKSSRKHSKNTYLVISSAKDEANNDQVDFTVGQSSNTFYYDISIPDVVVASLSTRSVDICTIPELYSPF